MKEYVWMRQGEVFPVTDKEFLALLNQNQIRALCPTDEPERQMVSQMELLLDERYVANGIVVERGLFGEAGGRNMRLPAKWEYELALRVAEMVPIVLLPEGAVPRQAWPLGMSEQEKTASPWDSFCTDAYVTGRYSAGLKECGVFETVLEAVLAEGMLAERAEAVQQFLGEMITHTGKYYRYYDATQPILIYLGLTECYNILNVFAEKLAAEFRKQGNRVEFYDTNTEDVQGLTRLLGKRYKASIGFQTWIMSVRRADNTTFFQDMIGGPKYNFIVDHPIWLQEQLQHVPARFYALTHDRNYQKFIQKYNRDVCGTYLLPPGGRNLAWRGEDGLRTCDVTFLGTYGNYRKNLRMIGKWKPQTRHLANHFLYHMRKTPNLPAETAFEKSLADYDLQVPEKLFLSLFGEMKAAMQCMMYYYREKVIGEILGAGIELHVYGDSWKESPFFQNQYLKIHPEVLGDEAVSVLQNSKISLNVMAWHKDGFTERLADSMLAGAVVVSDKSTQLEEFYADEMALFDLEDLQVVPEILRRLLKNEDERSMMAQRAREKALAEDTWEVRAKQLLKIIEAESGNCGSDKDFQ